MDINDAEGQFAAAPITFPDDQNFISIVGQNNSGKSTILRSWVKTVGPDNSYRVDVNRTLLVGEGALDKGYQNSYPSYRNTLVKADSDNIGKSIQPLQDFFMLTDEERKPIIDWYNNYFPNRLYEEREDIYNSASPMLLKVDGHSITKQGSGMRATLEIFIKLFDPRIKVLCIDEPELGLEPYLQKYLFRSLKDKSSNEKKIILATHSHHFLDLETIGNNYSCDRNSEGKIRVSQATDLREIIFRLLGNTLSSFLLPEKILILEGPSDFTFAKKTLELAGKTGYAIHGSDGSGNISYAAQSITQFLKFNKTNLPVYKNNIYVIADKPPKDILIRHWKKLLDDDDGRRICILPENGIEYYYPRDILRRIFKARRAGKILVDKYLAASPNSFNDVLKTKTQLAHEVAADLLITHLDDANNKFFRFVKALP